MPRPPSKATGRGSSDSGPARACLIGTPRFHHLSVRNVVAAPLYVLSGLTLPGDRPSQRRSKASTTSESGQPVPRLEGIDTP
ncbi:hypothetical protein BO78DRAFT_338252 [Aspergillus sclerotiicarbonarius CBS 121057]|uniref:Uncharacterized protein n=1 Tax=Aspergillus sclerotiicarbonarius (strain CBS 121057 / IBT 28362) TaxID=1448318 RepID=A0A319EFQ8_ASPSB|nr:hypothetical protein BO78DRAFT_338252 [Aspergillus sclerotiicarbonarius CBS 121057]